MKTTHTATPTTTDVLAVPAEMTEQVARLVEQAQFDGIQLTGEGRPAA